MKSAVPLFLLSILGVIVFAAPAYAYIDPGTGSFLIQGIIAAVVGLGVTLKLYWRKIKAALTGQAPADDDDDDE